MTDPADQDHDRDALPRHRFYSDLASWWPLISAPEEYAEEAAFAASLLRMSSPPTRTVLELGSGGGNNAFHLKREFEMCLVDLSEDMLAVSRQLNPDCEHLQGDMRTLHLGRSFDAVFVHDAIDYMTTEADLRQAVATAYEHCRVGGVAVLVPDNIAENFEPDTDHGGHDAPDGRGARYLSWSTDPDPDDTYTRADYAFLLRAADGLGDGGARYASLRPVSTGAMAAGPGRCRIPPPLGGRGNQPRPTTARVFCRCPRPSMME